MSKIKVGRLCFKDDKNASTRLVRQKNIYFSIWTVHRLVSQISWTIWNIITTIVWRERQRNKDIRKFYCSGKEMFLFSKWIDSRMSRTISSRNFTFILLHASIVLFTLNSEESNISYSENSCVTNINRNGNLTLVILGSRKIEEIFLLFAI